MISKRKLKERLIDICNGAGYVWDEEHEFFEASEGTLVALGNAIQGIERAFGFPSMCIDSNSRLRAPWRLHEYEDLDTMVDLVLEAIEYDLKKV